MASVIILVWQTVGGVRMADRTMREDGDLFRPLAIYAALLVVLVLALNQAVNVVSTYYRVEPKPYSTDVPLLEVVDGQIIVNGEIDFAMNSALIETVAAFPKATSVLLASDGGSIFAGRGMAITIEANHLSTKVENHCFSACTIVFMAGETRNLSPKAQLGFHGYSFDSIMRVQTLDVEKQEAKDRAYFDKRGISGAFIDRVFATSPTDIWIPSRAELIKAGVIEK